MDLPCHIAPLPAGPPQGVAPRGCRPFKRRGMKDVKGLIGKKVGMTQVFTEDGSLVPVTVIDASSCTVVGKRTPEKDRYSAVTLGFGEVKEKRLSRAELGTFKKAGTAARRHLKEFRLSPEEAAAFTVGEPV